MLLRAPGNTETQAHLAGKGFVDLKDVYVIHSQPCGQELDES